MDCLLQTAILADEGHSNIVDIQIYSTVNPEGKFSNIMLIISLVQFLFSISGELPPL